MCSVTWYIHTLYYLKGRQACSVTWYIPTLAVPREGRCVLTITNEAGTSVVHTHWPLVVCVGEFFCKTAS